MTQNNQTSTSKQNQDKEQHARELHDKIEQEQKQNEIDKQHKQKHEEVLEAQKMVLMKSLIISKTLKHLVISNQSKRCV